MNPNLRALLSAGLLVAASVCGAPLGLYVAPDGNDAWTGRRATADAARTDGPFATLQRARDEIRKLRKAAGLPGGGVVVELQQGTYELEQTFELVKQDAGTADAPIEYRAQPGETVRVLGGRSVTRFSPVIDPAVLAILDPAARGKVQCADLKAQGITDYGKPSGGGMELFFRAEPMLLARWPNEGFTRIVQMVGEAEKRGRHMTHKMGKWVYEGERPARWVAEQDPWVHGYWYHDWSDQRHKIKTIDTTARTIEVAPPYHNYGYRKGKWYYGYNLLCEIDQPGEWYVDRQAGVLYFWPPKAPQDGNAVVSVIGTAIRLQDVSQVTIRGLLIEAARGTGISVSGGNQNRVVGCTIRNVGGWGVTVSGGSGHGVLGCDITATGKGGILLRGGDRKTLTPARHFAENNHIHHYARINRVYQPGITLQGVGSRASHNLIHDAPHMGMGFGGNDHVIEFNEIHSVCYESNDAGAIYTGRNWTMRGNVIRNNYLHHINGFEGRGCVGVYLDDGFSSAEITGNVFYKVTRAAMIGGGRDTTIANNIFIDCVPAVHVDARGIGWANQYIVPGGGWHMQKKLADMPYQQAPWTKYPHLATILADEPYLPKHNLVARNIFIGGTWDGIRPKAKPHVTVKGNFHEETAAGFVDAANGDFRLRGDSPVLAQGFQQIPFAKIGLFAHADRASWPVSHSVRPMATPPPPPKRGPAPTYKVVRRQTAIQIDGTLTGNEWFGLAPKAGFLVEQGIRGTKQKPSSQAWASHDGKDLHVAIRNRVTPSKRLRTKPVWGENDAVELAFRNPAVKGASILLLRGYPAGQFACSTEAGAPFEVTQDVERAVSYSARVVAAGEWTAEWKIPLRALGIDPAKHQRILFNLSARKTAGLQWLMWRGTGGHTWDVDKAGVLELQ
jgi:hypothetical protein